jgi:SAM-dependent methyltransferase
MPVLSCQLCGSKRLTLAVDLGFHPLADTFLRKKQLMQEEVRYPLQMLHCKACGYAMNSYIVPAAKRYQAHEYSYDSSNSKVAIAHFEELATDIAKKTGLARGDLVVDIGGNVGTLLDAFKRQVGAKVLNVEPAKNIARLAKKNGIPTLQTFFDKKAAAAIKKRGGANVITSTNSFNHISDLNTFVASVARALHPKGAFVFEVPYLLHLIEKVAFDTIYLEHVSYFAVKPLAPFLKKHGFVITDIVENDYMGGSIRIIAEKSAKESSLVRTYIEREKKAGLYTDAAFESFREKVRAFRLSLLSQLIAARSGDGTVIGIGAATKGNTLLNYCGIDATMLDFITDASPLKIGKYTPGSHISIKSDEAITNSVTHALILPWNIGDFLKAKLAPTFPHITFIVPHA